MGADDEIQNNADNDAITEQEDAVALLQKELTECKEKYMRVLAESENARKRMQKEKAESQSFAVHSILLEFLQPLDHLEHALRHAENASPEIQHWAKGFEMILDQFRQVLLNNDVESFESIGKPFDPNFHEAIETEETDAFPDGTVMEQFAPGYIAGGIRVVRPAKVKVAIGNHGNKEKTI